MVLLGATPKYSSTLWNRRGAHARVGVWPYSQGHLGFQGQLEEPSAGPKLAGHQLLADPMIGHCRAGTQSHGMTNRTAVGGHLMTGNTGSPHHRGSHSPGMQRASWGRRPGQARSGPPQAPAGLLLRQLSRRAPMEALPSVTVLKQSSDYGGAVLQAMCLSPYSGTALDHLFSYG